ncbi:MAG: class I SAM-dependent methyltransferase [Saprospiraceae bacterium]|nr:class I SAM-dependent methyltransferase [Saprospiraceae bacterium]
MRQKEWFEDWFGTRYCKLLYRDRNAFEADLFTKNIVNLLNPNMPARILDVACGNGRHAEALSQYGYEVIGIDLHPDCISEAILQQKAGLSFYQHDMRRLFRINYFDIVLNLFTSFGYFERYENEVKAAYSLSANLKKGGFLVFDFLNALKLQNCLINTETKQIENVQYSIKRLIRNGRILKQIIAEENGQMLQFEEKVWLYELSDIKKLFEPFGLSILYTFGDYDLGEFHSEQSDRLIAVFVKN